ncbi:MAG TPA: hypothetical protein VLA91_11975 [Acidimicrobiia bacterium]|nr:hypothetical protein [Acidimicrobiia bacterium]
MTLTVTRAPEVRRPLPVTIVIALLAALGIGAVGGGFAMTFGIGGESMLPDEYLDALPLVNSWVVPGLILMIGFGFGSLLAAFGVWRRPAWAWLGGLERLTGHHWSWVVTIVIGVGQVIWITLELVSIPFSALMPTFGAIGLALILLPLTSSIRGYLEKG